MTGTAASLAGKTALVTGAATGIGQAVAAALAGAGARIVVNHNHTPDEADKTVAEIEAAGGTALAIAADVSSRGEYQAMVSRMLAEYGRWDVLVNNAAVAIIRPFAEVTDADLDLSFAVNVKGVLSLFSQTHAGRRWRSRR
jgi:3-oxoacyl-[acyl-carrier protein] reductase